MEFTCLKEEIQKGVQIAERIVSTRSTLPIIGNILFEANKNGLKLSANNLEVGVEISIPAQVSKEGSVLLSAKTISSIVSKLPAGSIVFKLKERGVVNLSYKKSNFSLNSLPADEFPSLSKVKEEKSFKIEAEILSEMIKQTIFASTMAEEKQILNGVLFDKREKTNLRLVATDGYRLAYRSQKVDQSDGEVEIIVPSRALVELNFSLEQGIKGEVKIIVSKEYISFKIKDFYLVSRLIQGQFPDYRQVIPKKNDTKIEIEKKAFLNACERAQIIAQAVANIVKIEIKGKELYISASAPDVGSIEEVLQAEISGIGKKSIAFNVRLIIDALKVIESEKVILELGQALNPGILRPSDGGDYIYIVMPIRTQEAITA